MHGLLFKTAKKRTEWIQMKIIIANHQNAAICKRFKFYLYHHRKIYFLIMYSEIHFDDNNHGLDISNCLHLYEGFFRITSNSFPTKRI